MNLTRREAAGGGRSGDKQGADVLFVRGKPRQLHGHQYLRRRWRSGHWIAIRVIEHREGLNYIPPVADEIH